MSAYYHGSSSENNNRRVVEHLVATTLLSSKEDVIRTYPSSKAIIDELESDYGNVVTLLYQVDATTLHTHPELTGILKHKKCDVIFFHHPHLGYLDTETSQEHALRHCSLLAHYFDSAEQLISDRGYIHVCLCSGAIQSWRLHEIVQHLQLQYCLGSPIAASRPLLEPFLVKYQNDTMGLKQEPMPEPSQNQFSNKTKVGGSRRGHWLGRYGYRHQPTFPQVTEFQTNVSSSYHFFLQPTAVASSTTSISSRKGRQGDDPSPGHVCGICRQEFPDPAALQAHQEAPALPAD